MRTAMRISVPAVAILLAAAVTAEPATAQSALTDTCQESTFSRPNASALAASARTTTRAPAGSPAGKVDITAVTADGLIATTW